MPLVAARMLILRQTDCRGSVDHGDISTRRTSATDLRQYVPALGRFLQVDPIEGGSANDYEYCLGDPVNCQDLDGLTAWTIRNRLVNPEGRVVFLRDGRHSGKRWSDGYGNFGLAHVADGHVGIGKRSAWTTRTQARADIRTALANAQWQQKQTSTKWKYVYCEVVSFMGISFQKEVSVVVDYRRNQFGQQIGVKTAWVNYNVL